MSGQSHPQLIVDCARGWIGTRFLHQGRLKKTAIHAGGVDCLGLLIGVAAELNLSDANYQPYVSFDQTNYSRYPDTHYLLYLLETLLTPVAVDQLQAGDVALFKLAGNPQHLAILSKAEGECRFIIHSYAQARKVVEHELDSHWQKLLVGAYRMNLRGS